MGKMPEAQNFLIPPRILPSAHRFGALHCDLLSVNTMVVMAGSGACCLDIG